MFRFLLCAAGLTVFAQGPCASDTFKRYDYVLGEWAVSRDGKAVGNVRYRKAVHGCAIVEDYAGPGGVSRKGLLYYEPRAARWEIVVSGTDGLLEGHETAAGVFTASGANFRLSAAGDTWSIAQDGAWKQTYTKASYPSAQSSETRHCDTPEHRQFDFWLGSWEVFNPRGALAGTNHIYSAARGCALVENWTAAGLTTGISLNFWDSARTVWRQVWVAPGGVLKVEGKWEGAALRFASPISRLTFTPNRDGSVRQYWEQTNDSGRTWSVAFDGTYRRAAERTREALIADLTSSKTATLGVYDGISDEQANFRQVEGRWTIREILDHLVAAEILFQQNAKKLSDPAVKDSVSGLTPGPIESILGPIVANRNQRLNAPEPLLPKASGKSLTELLSEFRSRRDASIQLAGSANLRGARAIHPLGASNLDAYQWLFTMAAHNRRHLEQAAEVMSDSRYPGAVQGLRRWTGLWKGAGKFNGRDADAELLLKSVLGGKFDELNINIEIAPGQSFHGRALYSANGNATWSDSYGNAYPVAGKWIDGKLVADWGDPVRGRSTYGLAPDGDLIVLDEVKRPDGTFAPFAKYKLKKQIVNQTSVMTSRQLSRLETESLKIGVLNVQVGADTTEAPAENDRVYFAETGRAMIEAGTQELTVEPGTLVQVRKGLPVRVHSVQQPLKMLVIEPKQ